MDRIRLLNQAEILDRFSQFVSAKSMTDRRVFYSHLLTYAGKEVDSQEIVLLITEALILQRTSGENVTIDLSRSIDALIGEKDRNMANKVKNPSKEFTTFSKRIKEHRSN